MIKETVLFEEVEVQYTASQGHAISGPHGYQIWISSDDPRYMDFLAFIKFEELGYWVKYYSDDNTNILIQELKK